MNKTQLCKQEVHELVANQSPHHVTTFARFTALRRLVLMNTEVLTPAQVSLTVTQCSDTSMPCRPMRHPDALIGILMLS